MALALDMCYCTIRFDLDAQMKCNIILPWGKYSYLQLPMGIVGSQDIFQEKMSDLMMTLDCISMYLDNLLTISKGTFNDKITKLEEVLL